MNSLFLATLLYPSLDPVAFRIGPLPIRWYGIAYLAAFTAGYAVLHRLRHRGILGVRREQLQDLVLALAAGVVVGGRLGWWLFYHRGGGAEERWYEPLAIWHGGMSFHGGLLGVIIAMYLWTLRSRVSFWTVADALALVAPIGLFFGRLANFVNAELVGRPTDVRWGVVFPGETYARHPSQLYEAALEGPVLLLLLWGLRQWQPRREGRLAAAFLGLYGAFRFAVEFTRQPDPQLGFVAFGWLTMGQILSIAMVLVSAVVAFATRRIADGERSAAASFGAHAMGDRPSAGRPSLR